MADIAPLTPLRYDLARCGGSLANVVAPPYDVIDAEQRAKLAARDPHNVVRLILPEGEGDAKYANAAATFDEWRDDGTLVRDDVPGFYRYDQRFAPPGGGERRVRRGFLALVRLLPFSARVVLPHERTLSGPKEDRLKLFRATRANLSPGFMLYRDPQRVLDAPLDRATLVTEFETPDGVEHSLWKVAEADAIKAIVGGVAKSTLLIADGHHRYETALRYSQDVDGGTTGSHSNAEHRFFMTFLTNGDAVDLVVFPTHRHVHSLPSFDFARLLVRAEGLFDMRRMDGAAAVDVTNALRDAGARGPSFAACGRGGEVALLTLRDDAELEESRALAALPEVLRRTDVGLLHAGLLEEALGITAEAQAAKTNLWYPQDATEALARIRGGGDAAGDVLFLMNATPVRDVRAVAEAGHVMPQKSTFFYPKVATGLAFHTLEPRRRVAL